MPSSAHDAARRAEGAARRVPGVTGVVAVGWREHVAMRGVHLTDVPHATLGATPQKVVAAVPAQTPAGTGDGRPPAILDGGPVNLPGNYPRTLREALVRAAEVAPGRGITFLRPDGSTEQLTYSRLLRDAGCALGGLRVRGVRPGDAVIFQFADNRAFITTFWACVLGGFLPTPIAPVADHRAGPGAAKLRNTWDFLGQPLIVTDLGADEVATERGEMWSADVELVRFAELAGHEHEAAHHPSTPDSPLLNLLTSGSTGLPKCVQHNNRSIVARTWGDCLVNSLTAAEVTLCSMPMDHVMGCVMAHVRDVFLACDQINATPEMFAARPVAWLDWIDRYGVTNLAAPNFAFALVNEHAEEIAAGHWNLGSLHTIYNAGEPVNSGTAHDFLRMLEPHGLPHDAMLPSWGMSETSSTVTHARLSRVDTLRSVAAVDKDSLAEDLRFVAPDAPEAVLLTDVGAPLPGVVLRVVDDGGVPVPEGRIGHLEITGATMMAGYHANAAADAESRTADGWFKTGDLAFSHRGGLFIAGRAKDLIIVNGANHLSQDIEAVVAAVEGVMPTAAAACGLFDPDLGTDRLILFYVPSSDFGDVTVQGDVVRAVKAAVAARSGLDAHAVIPVTAEEFPRTTSGKIQRGQLLTRYVAGEFDAVLRAVEVVTEGPSALPGWFLAPVWTPSPPPPAVTLSGGVCLVLSDDPDGPFLAALRSTHPQTSFVVRTASADEDHQRVVRDVLAKHGEIASVVHARTLSTPELEPLRAGLTRGVLSVVALVQALVANKLTHVDLLVATRLAESVNATLSGLVRTLADERPVASARVVDLGAAGHELLAARELGRTPDVVVAYADGQRLVPELEPVPVPEPAALVERPAFLRGGLLLVTGGLGGIGTLLARHLERAHDAKLVLVGRSPSAEPDYVRCDVTDVAQLRAAVEQAETRWNRRLVGVLHLAGAPLRDHWDDLDAHKIAGADLAAFEAVLAPKVLGACALAELLADRPDAALVLFSSVNGWFGGSGFGAYSSASSYLDGFAARLSADGRREVQALAWSQWSGVGMNAGAPTEAAAAARGFRSISEHRGIASFAVARAIRQPHVLIGVDAANPAITPFLAERATSPAVVVAYTGDPDLLDDVKTAVRDEIGLGTQVRVTHLPRLPEPGVDAAALVRLTAPARADEPPRPGLETQIAQIWCEVLGHSYIGRNQSFFEMGGSSVLTARVQRHMLQRLGLRLPLRGFYESPTVSAVAGVFATGS
jgi:acyl-CoA synthetase (AMP-forming)/AMP-acid ligase II/NAD(P)-dependent dehydrogenase (short-subunit alcohol dehydrogenase family)